MWRLEVEAAFLIASPVRKRRGGQWTLQIGSFSLLFGSGYKPREWWHHVQDTSSRLDLPSLNNSTPACSILRGLSSEWVWSDIMGIERKVALGGRLLIPRALSSSKWYQTRKDYKPQPEGWALPLADLKAAGGNNGDTLVKVSTVSLRHQRYIWETALC